MTPPQADNQSTGHKPPDGQPPAAQPHEILAKFIRVCSAALASNTPQEAAALMVNRITELVLVDRAVLVNLNEKHAIRAVTGGGAAAQDTSFADAVETVRHRYLKKREPIVIPKTFEGEPRFSLPLKRIQQSMGGTSILWLPLWLKNNEKALPAHALWLERWHGNTWEKPDIDLLHHAAIFLGHALIRPGITVNRTKKRLINLTIALFLVVMMLWPVTSSVTAPMRVAPDRPYHVFAPMDGILKELYVQPGQWVEKGALLFRYDARVLDKRLEEARQNVLVAQAKLARLEGAAHRDPEARAELPVQKLEVERAILDVKFYEKQRARAEIHSQKPGVVVLDDPDALIGSAIQTGEIVLSVADPSKTKIKIMTPVSDVSYLKEGGRVEVRLDSNPLRSYPAFITRIGFDVHLSENNVPSVLVEAIWPGEVPDVQPGQRGYAKIYGAPTRLGFQILRKPMIHLRSLTGF